MLEQKRVAEGKWLQLLYLFKTYLLFVGLKAKPKKGEEGYELYQKQEAEEVDREMELLPGT